MRTTQKRLVLFAFPLFIFIVLASSSAAEESEESKEAQKAPQPEPVTAVVTASRLEQPLERISASATVITKEDIKRQGAQTVAEVLRNVPGVHLSKFGGPGRQVNVFLRGAATNQTLILIDGVQVNSPTTGNFNFANLTTENIERIEIIRGPQSPLHGSDAMAGVIQIITRKGASHPKLTSWFEFGTLRTFYEGQSFTGSWRNISASASWSRLDTKGLGENDEWQDTNVSTKVNVALTEEIEAEFFYRYSNALVGIEDGAFNPDPNRHSKARQNIVGTTLTHQIAERWEQRLAMSFFHDTLFSVDPPDEGTTQSESRFNLLTDVYTFDWQHNVSLAESESVSDIFTWGYEFEHAASHSKGRFEKIIRNHGWYLQNLLELWERLYFTTGIRFEDNSAFGFDVNPKFGLSYLHRETGTRLKGNFGTAFRSPTLNQLFFPNFGDPSLQPEESIGFDLGIEQEFFDQKAFAQATCFYNFFDELIESRPNPASPNRSIATNVGKSRTYGVELEGALRPFPEMEFKIFYTFLQAETIERREPLIRRPKHSGGLDFNWRLFERWNWNVNLTVFDERYDSSFASGRPSRELNPNFSKLDTTLTFEATENLTFYFRIENLTNDDDSENLGFDSPGTQFFGGVRLTLA